jgi:hypothetical protein
MPTVWYGAEVGVVIKAEGLVVSPVHYAAYGMVAAGCGLTLQSARLACVRAGFRASDISTAEEVRAAAAGALNAASVA